MNKRTEKTSKPSRLIEQFWLERRLNPKYDAAERTQDLIDAIEAVSIAARWQKAEPITLELVMERITRGEHALALSALRALHYAGVLRDEPQDDGSLIYHLADE